jgi:hypothetical protein
LEEEMTPPNIYSVIGRNMILDIFSIPRVIDKIKQDVEKGYAENVNWKTIKDWNVWLAAIVDQCDDFRSEVAEEVEDALTPGLVYDIYFLKGEPKVVQQSYVVLDIVIEEDEENEEESVSESVHGDVIYWFDERTGDLRKIEVREDLTGEQWEIWPDMEDFTAEQIYVDRDMADAEGIG